MYRLLIIDDEETIRNGMRAIIKKGQEEKFEFFEAEDGRGAIEIIDKFEPDIIFNSAGRVDRMGADQTLIQP